MSGTRQHAPDQDRVDGVFVLGMYGSGSELVQCCWTAWVFTPWVPEPTATSILSSPSTAGCSKRPEVRGRSCRRSRRGEVARILGRFADEAQSLLFETFEERQETGPGCGLTPPTAS